MNFIEACRTFISTESTPSHTSKEIAECAATFCRERGLDVILQSEFVSGEEHMNVIARPGPRPPSLEFLFQTHLDTVDPGPFPMWVDNQQNPFDASIIDGKIYGLGAADAKLDFLCKLEAIAAYKEEKNWKLPPVLVGTFGEETGMAGALKLIRKNMLSAKMAVIGEPSNLNLVYASMGLARVEIRIPFSAEEITYRQEHNLRESTSTQSRVFHGKAAHSATPHFGESAIVKMFDHLLQLPESLMLMEIDGGINDNSVPSHAFLEIDLAPVQPSIAKKISEIYKAIKNLEEDFLSFRDEEFTPAYPTLNIGLVRTFEDHIFMSGTCRMSPLITQNIYQKWMDQLRAVCEKQDAQFQITDYKKPFRTAHNSILVKGCLDEIRNIGINGKLITQASVNEASIFSRVGVDCVCFGPGLREGNVHTPHEHVLIEDLYKATEFYKKVIERFCL